jgi:catechol 2,3-dioxygenase-like lactoylglutathione lyase family enzyme
LNYSLRFVALFVPDLRAAEHYYQTLFEMELVGREALLKDGLWYTLPFDKGWDNAEAAGIELGMLGLRKDKFALALFKGDAPVGQVYAIGLNIPVEEIARVRGRLPKDTEILEDYPHYLEFLDPYRITWHISIPGTESDTSGNIANRWLKL